MRLSHVAARWPSGSNTHRFCRLSHLRTVGPPSSQRPAKCPFATLSPSPSRAKHLLSNPGRGLLLGPTVHSIRSYQSGPPKTSKPSVPATAETGRKGAKASSPKGSSGVKTESPRLAPDHASDPGPPLGAEHQAVLVTLDSAKSQLLAGIRVPDENEVLSALRVCQMLASTHRGRQVRHGSKMGSEPNTSASSLLSLDGTATKPTKATAPAASDTKGPIELSDYIARVAFEIISHPSVIITPQILDAYIGLQDLLGDPDTLPYVLALYASKPEPEGTDGSLKYVERNFELASNAIDPMIAEKALNVAIEAKNLDAAVGVVATAYGTNAFIKQKLLRKALLPAAGAVAMPFVVWLVASRLAKYQQLYDDRTATIMAAMGLLVYVGSTTFMGFLAIFTHNDQMNRVTWAPGTRLFERWLREEERAGLDKVACAFGFSEVSRHGEEEGTDFESLKKYILLRGMVLDRVESMPGMK